MNGKTQEEINQETHAKLQEIGAKMDDVWQILSAFKLFGRAIMWVALVLGSVGTAVGGVVEGIKFFFKHK